MPEATPNDNLYAVDLSKVHIKALLKELKARSYCIVFGALIDDDQGKERIYTLVAGSVVAARGMLKEMDEALAEQRNDILIGDLPWRD